MTNPPNSQVVKLLGPFIALGRSNPIIVSVTAALKQDAEDLSRRAIELGISAEERQWWSGAASHAVDLLNDINGELDRLEQIQIKESDFRQ